MAQTILTLMYFVGCGLFIRAVAQPDPVCRSCPSRNCTYDKRLACSCSSVRRTIEIVDAGDREYVNVSLGFAVDDTGSMAAEIAAVKASIQSVVTATSGIFDKFVIASFNDPYVSNVLESADPVAINTFVSGINANGGGDCDEMALSCIAEVARRVSPGSVIFVFTDASSKDSELEPTVKALLKFKNIRLNVLATGNLCEKGAELRALTNATNGTIYTTLDRSYAAYVMNYIKNFAKYSIRFVRGMPRSLDDLKTIANGTCSCVSNVENIVCAQPNESDQSGASGPNKAIVKLMFGGLLFVPLVLVNFI